MKAMGPMRWRHPNRAALRRWLQGEADEHTDAHVATCERCAVRLETLAEESDPGGPTGAGELRGAGRPPGLRAALEAALAAPSDLNVRLTTQVHELQQQARWQDVVVDAVGGGLDTLRLLMGDKEDDG